MKTERQILRQMLVDGKLAILFEKHDNINLLHTTLSVFEDSQIATGSHKYYHKNPNGNGWTSTENNLYNLPTITIGEMVNASDEGQFPILLAPVDAKILIKEADQRTKAKLTERWATSIVGNRTIVVTNYFFNVIKNDYLRTDVFNDVFSLASQTL